MGGGLLTGCSWCPGSKGREDVGQHCDAAALKWVCPAETAANVLRAHPQASASQPPLPPALGVAPAAAAAAPPGVVPDVDETPMPVAITADEANLFQV